MAVTADIYGHAINYWMQMLVFFSYAVKDVCFGKSVRNYKSL